MLRAYISWLLFNLWKYSQIFYENLFFLRFSLDLKSIVPKLCKRVRFFSPKLVLAFFGFELIDDDGHVLDLDPGVGMVGGQGVL
jgi:hypothetical protein